MKLLVFIIYNLLFPIFFFFYLPVFITKLVRRGGSQEGFWERFGIYSASKKALLKKMQTPIWIHAVSVGETVAALSFIREWSKQEPDLKFVLSTTTSTGQSIARKQLPENVSLIYCPVDFSPCVWSALDNIKPQMLIIFEVEVWPNLIVLASLKKVKTALVNCRMSDKSARGYSKYRWFFRYIFSRFFIICVQTEEDASRIKSIIGDQPQINICNTMKFDQIAKCQNDNTAGLINSIFPDNERIIFIAASTHPGEEKVVAKLFKALVADFPSLKLIIAPRHTERTNEIEKTLKDEEIDYILLTELRKKFSNPNTSAPEKKSGLKEIRGNTLIVNTTGELMSFFPVSDIIFMGKSLAGNKGGHNIIEPAIFGKPILFGANMDNFRYVAKIFKENNAVVQVENEQGLFASLQTLLADSKERQRLGRISKEVVEKNRGAINKTIKLLRR